ncbi:MULTISPECIES: hypothetical protein [unclassified Clostridium]|uniref:hypothetical protein n=1 Tax=unclassified Clostridium TaxID=2614128 RepID=UPI0002978B97|nr:MULTISPECIES: hypothetical protein [unclassified Clostridium]EKQ57917.1 MAG: hypothetical protein A370_00424 [Clostridium sp. Maddingley MBC34-26]
MKKDNNYLSIIIIIAATCFSLFIIAQNFLSQTNEGRVGAALPLIIPALALLIPLIAVSIIMIFREAKYRRIRANGVQSAGFIKKATETGNYIKKQPEVKLELNVLDENGNAYSGELTTIVHFAELELLKEGEPIPVIYNINNKNEITIDKKPDVRKFREQIENYKAKGNA